MFLGDSSSLVGKVQRELVKFLQAPGTTTLLTKYFHRNGKNLKIDPLWTFARCSI